VYSVEKLYRPSTLIEALDILAEDKRAIPIAGGTDIIVKMRATRAKGVRLVSVSSLVDLKGIEEDADGNIIIGAASTFTEVAEHPLIVENVPLLKTAALSMGGPQTQNVATIGGNVCNGATSADSAPSLFALDAVLELVSAEGRRIVPITEFYISPGKVNKMHGELLTHIILPFGRRTNRGSSYIKMSTRNAMDISTLGSAAVCVLDTDGSIQSAAIALGTAGPTPMRCKEAETVLVGKFLTNDLLSEAGKKAAAAANPRSSWRASATYRKHLAEELSARAFREAFEAAGGTMR